ncbi:MAG: hypothetical protein LBQ66_15025 [Planctomycetaceae bacterium]|nr:hypothetical protein [Planctomycetaceae bacterium]
MTKRVIGVTLAMLFVFTFAVTFVSAEDTTTPATPATNAKETKPACPNCATGVYHYHYAACGEPVVIYRRTFFGLGNYYKPVVVYPSCAPAPVYRAYPVFAPRCYYPAPVYPAYPVYPACYW